MTEKSKEIFGNPIKGGTYKKVVRSKKKYAQRFGDDTQANYPVFLEKNAHIGNLLGGSLSNAWADTNSGGHSLRRVGRRDVGV